jgi:hypothetical protein
METKKDTTDAELFYALRNAEIEMASSLIFLIRTVQLMWLILTIAAAVALYEFIDHFAIALCASGILVTSIAAIFVTYFALPASVDEFFESPEDLAAIAKQEKWRLPD